MLSTRAERTRKIIIHRENGTPTMPENTVERVETSFSPIEVTTITNLSIRTYKALIALRGGLVTPYDDLDGLVWNIYRAQLTGGGEDMPSAPDTHDQLYCLVLLFILETVSETADWDGDDLILPTQPIV